MVKVKAESCTGCGLCAKDCPFDLICIKRGKAVFTEERCMKCGHCAAVCPEGAVYIEEYGADGVQPYDKEKFNIDSGNLLNFIRYRRSVRRFLNKPVEDEKINKIIEAGKFSPTGGNDQGVSFIVINKKIELIKGMAIKRLKVMTDGSEGGLRYFDKERYGPVVDRIYSDYISGGKDRLFFDAPAAIVNLSKSLVDATLAASNMELMANALGLGAFFCGFFVFTVNEDAALKRELGMKEDETAVTCLALGYPNVRYLRTVPRKKPDIRFL